MTTKIMVAAGSVASRRPRDTVNRPPPPPFYLSIISTIRSQYYYPDGCTDQRRLTLPNLYTVCIGGGERGGGDGEAR